LDEKAWVRKYTAKWLPMKSTIDEQHNLYNEIW
jgi:hypothetical protein